MSIHKKKPEVLLQVHELLVGLVGGTGVEAQRNRELANKAGVTKAVAGYVVSTAKLNGGQRQPQLLKEGIKLLTALAPPVTKGELDFKSAEAVLHALKEEGAPDVQEIGLKYFIECMTGSEEGLMPSEVESMRKTLDKRRGHLIELNLPEIVVKAMLAHECTKENYELHCTCCQALRCITDGADAKVSERRQNAADAGAIAVILAAIKGFPKDGQGKVGKGKKEHLHDHGVGGIRNITAASDELSRKAREAGARKEWVTKG